MQKHISEYNAHKITDGIWIGTCFYDQSDIQQRNIKYIINIGAYVTEPKYVNLYHKIDVDDTSSQNVLQHFDAITTLIHTQLLLKDGDVLIHCHAGISRSVTMTVAYFIRFHCWTVEYAISYIKSKRPQAQPNPNFMEQLRTYANKCQLDRIGAILSRIQVMDSNIKAIETSAVSIFG
jgi:protein tyrosine/serine phosphatase